MQERPDCIFYIVRVPIKVGRTPDNSAGPLSGANADKA